MEVVIGLVAVVAVVALIATFVAVRRRDDSGSLLEPPPAPRASVDGSTDTLNQPSSSTIVREPGGPPPDEIIDDAQLELRPDDETVAEIEEALTAAVQEQQLEAVKPRFRDRITRARSTLSGYLGSIKSRSGVTSETWDELEEALLLADVGIRTTTSLLDDLRKEVDDKGIGDPEALLAQLKGDMKVRLSDGDRRLALEPGQPNVWLFVGVNGVGKTTSIGKVAHRQIDAGHTVVMAAGDTFRAAAAEQLETWAERTGADIVRGSEGGDPSSIIFDAVQRAGSRGADLVLADTAGRLHTKVNLMEELRKVRRVADREPGKVTEVLLVIDATTGQNGLAQAKEFTEATDVTGIVLTKLDGSAKGGIVLAIAGELGIPIKLVGLGETVEDLVEFDPDEFVEALFS
jgi:fused signal recognition particle receptor